MIVLDASACVELLLQTENGVVVRNRIAGDVTVHAPHLIDVEVTQALRRLLRMNEIDDDEAHEALASLSALGVERYDHATLIPRLWELRENFTVCDACYIALAEALSAPLLTCDTKLVQSKLHDARVEVIAA